MTSMSANQVRTRLVAAAASLLPRGEGRSHRYTACPSLWAHGARLLASSSEKQRNDSLVPQYLQGGTVSVSLFFFFFPLNVCLMGEVGLKFMVPAASFPPSPAPRKGPSLHLQIYLLLLTITFKITIRHKTGSYF